MDDDIRQAGVSYFLYVESKADDILTSISFDEIVAKQMEDDEDASYKKEVVTNETATYFIYMIEAAYFSPCYFLRYLVVCVPQYAARIELEVRNKQIKLTAGLLQNEHHS